MITTIEVKGFRALRYCRVDLQEFQMFVGPNATGKSTFFDVFAFVRDILASGLKNAVFGDLRLSIPVRAADPKDITWLRQGGIIEIAITARIPEHARSKSPHDLIRYELAINTDDLTFFSENVWKLTESQAWSSRNEGHQQRSLFPIELDPPDHVVVAPNRQKPPGWRKIVGKVPQSGNDYFRSESSNWNNLFRLGPEKSALANLPEDTDKFPAATWFKRFLMEGVHHIALNAESMRHPARAGSSTDFLPDGSSLPWVIYQLEQQNRKRFLNWISHVKTALPDVVKIHSKERPEDRSRYIVLTYSNGLEAPSWLLSDGTLRLLALTLLAYMPKKPSLLFIEEPENGIHPRALETILQSLRSIYDSQVFCATHSTLVLSLLGLDSLYCFAKTNSGAIDIVRGPDHPTLKHWRSTLHLGDLFATGVLE